MATTLMRLRIQLFAATLLLVFATAAVSFAAQGQEAGTQQQAEAENTSNDRPLQLAPVVVTAEKRSENVQEIPSSISVISDMQMTDSGITDIEELSSLTPNLFISNWGSRSNSFIFIRGIGAVNNDPAVGYYVDDVSYMNSGAFDSNLYDIERIEVLRGPQGTLYGRNSLGGVINIVTKEPDNETHAGLTQRFGNYNLYETELYVRKPIINDKLFLGLSGNYQKHDGYSHNDYLDEDGDNLKSLNGRAHLRWMPSQDLDVILTVDGERIDDGAYPITRLSQVKNDPHRYSHDTSGSDERDSFGTSLRTKYDAEALTITSITSYRHYDDRVYNDQDFMPIPMMTSKQNLHDSQVTQEFRFASPKDNGNWKWLGGLYGFYHERDDNLILDFAPGVMLPTVGVTSDTDSIVDTMGTAVFGQATYTLFDKLDLTAGLRLDYERSAIDYENKLNGMQATKFDDSVNNNSLLPKFQIAYHLTDDVMTYATISRGYRSGGFNTAFLKTSDRTFDPEYSWNYELGAKTSWFNNRVNFNAAAFYITIEDQQVTTTLPNANTVIRNAGKSHNMGFELEGNAILFEGLTAEANFGYTYAEFTKYKDGSTDYKDNQAPFVPRYTYLGALQYRRPLIKEFNYLWNTGSLDLFARAEVQGTGPFYWDVANNLKQDPYEIFNFRVGFETEYFDIIAWCRNAFDKKYAKIAFDSGAGYALGQAGDPQTFGLTLRARF
ncbi:TonB-dependent receptor [Halodesulfovibrio aestuarii]|uniref:Iron complex outermembrane recepter protein n=1 Tax=Halodesulfovibrio aestuarii TaxID=126333 RepID=A0A8G2CBJ5_9BACT|nr:TonB-dependent receptor [Halodesulfovibrio aestuarii]SHJ55916.1 iron complex outermembrane recepter protein [Halodesulfovibrio aestuarii]